MSIRPCSGVIRSLRRLPLWLLLAALPAAADEDQWPLLAAGQWGFHTDVNGQKRLEITCTDPIADVKASVLELDQKNCTRTPVRKRRGSYVFRIECPSEDSGDEDRLQGTFSLKAASDSAFRMESISKVNGKSRREIVEAKRRGDCK